MQRQLGRLIVEQLEQQKSTSRASEPQVCEAQWHPPQSAVNTDPSLIFTIKTIADWIWRWVQQQDSGCYDKMHVAQLVVAAIFGSVHSAGMVRRTCLIRPLAMTIHESINTVFVNLQTIAGCLYELCLRPEYIEPLQVEAERAVRDHGAMSKEAIESLTKIDSFIKECQRFRPLAPSTIIYFPLLSHDCPRQSDDHPEP